MADLAIDAEPARHDSCRAGCVTRPSEIHSVIEQQDRTQSIIMQRFTYPHTIDNGAGERLTFLRRVPTDRGERLEVENVVGPGAGPPMHVHHYQEEALGRP